MLEVVPSILDIIAFGLEPDVLPPDTVALAADVAHHVTVLARTAVRLRLKLGNPMVKERLPTINLRAPPALAVVSPRLLAAVFVFARL